jgi:O-acetyl-ADP-ribose deacetylase (regulator of RNase III)
MIEYKRGDILKAQAVALVNPVNCSGVMGKGLARQFKNKFFSNFQAYTEACRKNELQPGKVMVFQIGIERLPHYIINFPTQRRWNDGSTYEEIESTLRDLIDVISQRQIPSVAIPAIGCGQGGLEWEEVRRRIENIFNYSEASIMVFPPIERLKRYNKTVFPQMTLGRASLISLMRHHLDGLIFPYVGLMDVQRLLYFLQESGEPLNLQFIKGAYGPYAGNLRKVLTALDGYYIGGYVDGGDWPDRYLDLLPGATAEADEFLRQYPETNLRLERIADLIVGFESPFGTELLALVHWVATRDQVASFNDLVRSIYGWNKDKKQFSIRQLAVAAEVLSKKGWIPPLNVPKDLSEVATS